ncbi:flavodoxin [Beggiatoa alba B18LD]|uniref:Flavodoxin n=1 Tax=Beggiatoa alba B18LD TaxID=395493 RepID=I3CII6_9GAMM|nr:flavodoxin domain-containing protein [Beggiatoa alba]EIJ43429.1 flavodoxin [Beggiatoa alba B18LD]
MKKKVLITYASRAGSTQGIAQAIGEVFVRHGADVELRFILDVKDLQTYDIVIIGSPIRDMAWLPEALRFIVVHQQVLKHKQIAYFIVGMTLREDTQTTREKALTVLNPIKDLLHPVEIGLFAGALVRDKRLKYFWWLVAKITGLPEGDYRNFHSVREWADQLAKRLLPPPSQPTEK